MFLSTCNVQKDFVIHLISIIFSYIVFFVFTASCCIFMIMAYNKINELYMHRQYHEVYFLIINRLFRLAHSLISSYAERSSVC